MLFPRLTEYAKNALCIGDKEVATEDGDFAYLKFDSIHVEAKMGKNGKLDSLGLTLLNRKCVVAEVTTKDSMVLDGDADVKIMFDDIHGASLQVRVSR